MSKSKKAPTKSPGLTFEDLVRSLREVDRDLSVQAKRAVNLGLTLRNWLFGWHIEEYERHGVDRAQYGEKLMGRLADVLTGQGVSRCDRRELYRYRTFYLAYPQIVEALPPQFRSIVAGAQRASRPGPGSGDATIRETEPPHSGIAPKELITRLSFSHFVELLAVDDPLKRSFYEAECIRGNWGVRELKRQIASLYFERTALSRDKKRLARLTHAGADPSEPHWTIRDPYVFEFVGLKAREVMSESHLEDQLLDKLQEFLLELGHGFCFEARQKRILIGDSHFFIDLVFYHRILKCHVLIELKLEAFSHENIGQMNTYVSWYTKHMRTEGDNPPIGILLCAQKDQALVEYALAGMDNQLFVSKYQLHLPRREELQRELERTLREEG
jgi:predicted nuclease of restriction endonuclease-like (RecB) superfamily